MSKNPWRIPDHDPDKKSGRKRGSDNDHPNGYRRNYDRHPEEEGGKLGRLLAFFLGISLLLAGLSVAFPETSLDDPYLIRGLLIITIFGGAAVYWSRSSLYRTIKAIGAWVLIITGISVFYLYQSDFGTRFMAALDPAGAMEDSGALVLQRSRDRHFWIRIRINGIPVRMIVDTGASNIVLSPEDASRIGINPDFLVYDRTANTANGPVKYARQQAKYISMGDYNFQDIPITINSADMDSSLLGMSLLNKFSSIEIKGDLMILRK